MEPVAGNRRLVLPGRAPLPLVPETGNPHLMGWLEPMKVYLVMGGDDPLYPGRVFMDTEQRLALISFHFHADKHDASLSLSVDQEDQGSPRCASTS